MSDSFLTNLFGGNKASMTCKDMSVLFDKRHDSVKRTIKTLVSRGVIELPHSVVIPTATKPVEIFVFKGNQGKRDSLIVAAQISPEFTASIVDRWIYLENEVKSLTEQLEAIQRKDNNDALAGSFHGYGLNERKLNKKENHDIEQDILARMQPFITNLTLH